MHKQYFLKFKTFSKIAESIYKFQSKVTTPPIFRYQCKIHMTRTQIPSWGCGVEGFIFTGFVKTFGIMVMFFVNVLPFNIIISIFKIALQVGNLFFIWKIYVGCLPLILLGQKSFLVKVTCFHLIIYETI